MRLAIKAKRAHPTECELLLCFRGALGRFRPIPQAPALSLRKGQLRTHQTIPTISATRTHTFTHRNRTPGERRARRSHPHQRLTKSPWVLRTTALSRSWVSPTLPHGLPHSPTNHRPDRRHNKHTPTRPWTRLRTRPESQTERRDSSRSTTKTDTVAGVCLSLSEVRLVACVDNVDA